MGDELNQVIDKVAEKVGIAVEAAGPIAETVIREAFKLGIATTVCGVALVAVASISLFVLVRVMPRVRKTFDDPFIVIFPWCAFTVIACVVGVSAVFGGLSSWLAPTLTVIESLK